MNKKKLKICVVIPCYRVVDKIDSVINKINFNIIDKVFIVDDCCPENTGSYLKKKKLKNFEILILKNNLGVGGATMIGFKKAIKNNYDIIFKVDGDGQHDPKDITKFLRLFKMKNINFCKGTRFFNKSKKEIPFIRYYGNICLTFLSRITCKNYSITDVVNGFLGIELKLLKKINLNSISKDFFFEEDLLFHVSLHETKIGEVPIKTLYYEKSNLNPIKTIIPFIIKHAKNLIIRCMYDIFKKKIY